MMTITIPGEFSLVFNSEIFWLFFVMSKNNIEIFLPQKSDEWLLILHINLAILIRVLYRGAVVLPGRWEAKPRKRTENCVSYSTNNM